MFMRYGVDILAVVAPEGMHQYGVDGTLSRNFNFLTCATAAPTAHRLEPQPSTIFMCKSRFVRSGGAFQ